jgi:DoxX-like family
VQVRSLFNPGIYVERVIHSGIDDVWRLSQTPDLHERWDLRFTCIRYLPREMESEPQRFLYETRIGFGMSVAGTGESVGERVGADGSAISSLRFDSDDPKSLIRRGAGYWRYIPVDGSTRFLTWYDYEARFGIAGRLVNRMVFRPLMGWATAWSFDRLRLWIEEDQTPEASFALASIHAVARVTIAFIWFWQGLIPKLIFRDIGEKVMLAQSGVPANVLPWLGGVEVVIALVTLLTWRRPKMLLVNIALMVVALGAVALKSPEYLWEAFNPVTLNLPVVGLSLAGYVAGKRTPFAGRCLRVKPRGE